MCTGPVFVGNQITAVLMGGSQFTPHQNRQENAATATQKTKVADSSKEPARKAKFTLAVRSFAVILPIPHHTIILITSNRSNMRLGQGVL